MKNILSINDLSKKEILDLIFLAEKIKKSPQNYNSKLKNKVLLDIFEKPSLRTRLSFEVAVYQLGGHTIFYDLGNSPLGKGKESIEDTSRVISRYIDVVMARLYSQQDLSNLAKYGSIPIINGLTDYEHPCQILGDFLTIKEKLRKLSNIKLAYIGDAKNNVTHSLMFACSKLKIKMSIACPKTMQPLIKVKGIEVTQDINKAVKDSDIIYTDSWMSYQSPKALFMHCLPAQRGEEVTNEVIESKKSIVFDQAENRLHIQKAVLLWCMNKV